MSTDTPTTLTPAFHAAVYALLAESTPTADLERRARARIAALPDATLLPERDLPVPRLLGAMLDGAARAGGLRYTAGAVCACADPVALASDWFEFLLLPFKIAYRAPHTPCARTAVDDELEADAPRPLVPLPSAETITAFRTAVKARDQRCVITGLWNRSAPHLPEDARGRTTYVQAAHILRRALLTTARTAEPRPSATYDLARHFAGLSDTAMARLRAHIDAPQNGLLLDATLHAHFDAFAFCLLPLDTARAHTHTYAVHWLAPPPPLYTRFGPPAHRIALASRAVPLPDPAAFALHAGVACALHGARAGALLDDIIDTFGRAGSPVWGARFGEADLALRVALYALAAHQSHQLPPWGPEEPESEDS